MIRHITDDLEIDSVDSDADLKNLKMFFLRKQV